MCLLIEPTFSDAVFCLFSGGGAYVEIHAGEEKETIPVPAGR